MHFTRKEQPYLEDDVNFLARKMGTFNPFNAWMSDGLPATRGYLLCLLAKTASTPAPSKSMPEQQKM